MKIAPAKALAFRIKKHFLDKQAPKGKLADVAGLLGGIQTQVMSAAQVSLGVRVRGIKPDDVIKALWKDKSLAKMWTLRGTLHLIPADDVSLYLAALKPVSEWVEAWAVKFGLPVKEIDKLHNGMMKALDDGALTRKEICERIKPMKGSKSELWLRSNWGGTVKIAMYRGDVIFGPSSGNEARFIKRDDWLPGREQIDEKEAQAELLRKYLSAYGPADARDFSYWSGLKSKVTKQAFSNIADEITGIDLDGRTTFLLSSDVSNLKARKSPKPVVRLLPNFDVYLLGHKYKEHMIEKKYYTKVYRQAAWISSVVLIDGVVEGVWRCNEKKKKAQIEIETFRKFTSGEKDLVEEEAGKIVNFRWGERDFSVKIRKV